MISPRTVECPRVHTVSMLVDRDTEGLPLRRENDLCRAMLEHSALPTAEVGPGETAPGPISAKTRR